MADEIKEFIPETIPEFWVNTDNIPWLNSEQLSTNISVQTPWYSGSFDTSDATLATTDNIYNLSIPNPDWEILSFTVDWRTNIIQISVSWSSVTAYLELETALQDWLWEEYSIQYISWTNYTIIKNTNQTITLTRPALVRELTISPWNTITQIDIIIDWTTYNFDWATYATVWDIFTYLDTNLDPLVYYTKATATELIIAKIDTTIPVITSTTYNSYEYTLWAQNADSAAWKFLDYFQLTTDWNEYRVDKFANSIFHPWTDTINMLNWANVWVTSASTLSNSTGSILLWIEFDITAECKFTYATKASICTATKAKIVQWATLIEEVSFVWDIATFTSILQAWTYSIIAHSDWAIYNSTFTNNQLDDNYHLSFDVSTAYNFIDLNTELIFTDAWYNIYDVIIDAAFWGWNYLTFSNTDYSAITASRINTYTSGQPDDTVTTTLTTNTNTALETVAVYTELITTFTLSSFNYVIPVKAIFKKITLTATSSVWDSEWIYEWRSQSCTTKHSTTTEFIADKIFYTDSNNFWNIVSTRTWWFVINLTVSVSNKINFVCT
jgi:hypothetical protein